MLYLCRTPPQIHKTAQTSSIYAHLFHPPSPSVSEFPPAACKHVCSGIDYMLESYGDHTSTHLYLLNVLAALSCFAQRPNTVEQKPIRTGLVLLLHKGQSLRVALGEVCEMEKCSHPSPCPATGPLWYRMIAPDLHIMRNAQSFYTSGFMGHCHLALSLTNLELNAWTSVLLDLLQVLMASAATLLYVDMAFTFQ